MGLSLFGKGMPRQEKKLFNDWRKANGLDKYDLKPGAPVIGGSPTFNEDTDKRESWYDSVYRLHPDRPWLNMGTTDTGKYNDRSSILG